MSCQRGLYVSSLAVARKSRQRSALPSCPEREIRPPDVEPIGFFSGAAV
jgi:hypothetical protein